MHYWFLYLSFFLLIIISWCGFTWKSPQSDRPRSYEDIQSRLTGYFFPESAISSDPLLQSYWEANAQEFIQQGDEIYWTFGSEGPELLTGADRASFQPLLFGFAKDKHSLYYGWLKVDLPHETDTISIHNGQRYIIIDDTVYYLDFYHRLQLLTGADPRTFEVFAITDHDTQFTHYDATYAKDASHVWWNTVLISEADVSTFAPLQGIIDGRQDFYGNIAKDHYHYYHRDQIVSEEQAHSLITTYPR